MSEGRQREGDTQKTRRRRNLERGWAPDAGAIQLGIVIALQDMIMFVWL